MCFSISRQQAVLIHNGKIDDRATELYPDDYDFSIIFDSVENRKLRHDMSRKNIDEVINLSESDFDLK